jgi:hypothetical protein
MGLLDILSNSPLLLIVSTVMLYGFFYYSGKEVTKKEVTDTIDKTLLQMNSNLKCDLCDQTLHLTELEGKWACDSCIIKNWAKHCPVCGKDMPLADTKMRVDHIAEHERRGEL